MKYAGLVELPPCRQAPQSSGYSLHFFNRSHVSSDVDGSFQEKNVSDMDITSLSMEVVHPFKNPSTNSVTTFLSVDKLYELASTQTLTYTCIPPGVKQTCHSRFSLEKSHRHHLIHVIWSRNQDEIPSHDQTDGSLIQFQATEQMSQFAL
jgi:hypothetical protein